MEPSNQNNSGQPDALDQRVQRLEEALGFAQYDRDQLHQQLLALMSELRAAQKKLALLELRLDNKDASPDEPRDERDSDEQ